MSFTRRYKPIGAKTTLGDLSTVGASSGDIYYFDGTDWTLEALTGLITGYTQNAEDETITGDWTFSGLIDLTPQSEPAASEGRFWYDSAFDTLAFWSDNSDSPIHLSQDNTFKARNSTGVTITKGQAVYVNGATGNRPNVALARADSITTARAVGVAMHDIPNNTDGNILTTGNITDIDTSSFTAGDELFLSATTAGALQNTKPTGTDFAVIIGECTVSNPSVGEMNVRLRPTAAAAQKNIAQTITGDWTFRDELTVEDALGTDSVTFSHDGTDFNADFTNTADWNITNLSTVRILDGADLFLYDGSDTDYARFYHDGTDFNTAFVGTTDWNIRGLDRINLDNETLIRFLKNDGTADGTYLYRAAGDALRLHWDGNVMILKDSGDNNMQWQDSAGTAFMGTDITNSLFEVFQGNKVRTYSAGNDKWFDFYHDDTKGVIEQTGGDALYLSNGRGCFYVETIGLGDDASGTIDIPNGNGGLVFLAVASPSGVEGVGYAHLWVTGSTIVDINSGATFAIGNSTNPDTDGRTNVWVSPSGTLNIKNRRGAFRYTTVYILTGDT